MPMKFFSKSLVLVVFCSPAWAGVSLVWKEPGAPQFQTLKNWQDSDISALKSKSYQDSTNSNWNGVLLSDLIQKGLDAMPTEKRATVDLVLVHSGTGEKILIPRYAIVKYPILLAYKKGQKEGPFRILVPSQAVEKISKAGLPVEKFHLSPVSQIELSNYQGTFGTYFLKRRTDPAAMRGEKLFVQNCLACHLEGGRGQKSQQIVMDRKHPLTTTSMPSFNERDWRALASYFQAYLSEVNKK